MNSLSWGRVAVLAVSGLLGDAEHDTDIGSESLLGPCGADVLGQLRVETVSPLRRLGDGPKDADVGLDQIARRNPFRPLL